MKITRFHENFADHDWEGWHVLVVAESGFSVLDFLAGRLAIDGATIHDFADRVNETDESGTLHPRAPISAIPRKFLREWVDRADASTIKEFKRHIASFIRANESTIRAPRIVVELHVSADPVPPHLVSAVEEVFASMNPLGIVSEVAVAV